MFDELASSFGSTADLLHAPIDSDKAESVHYLCIFSIGNFDCSSSDVSEAMARTSMALVGLRLANKFAAVDDAKAIAMMLWQSH
jgi:hypothetical protein